jgi:hypothetical protein
MVQMPFDSLFYGWFLGHRMFLVPTPVDRHGLCSDIWLWMIRPEPFLSHSSMPAT